MANFIEDVLSPHRLRKMRTHIKIYFRTMTLKKAIIIFLALLVLYTITRIFSGAFQTAKRLDQPRLDDFWSPFNVKEVDLYEEFTSGGINSGLTSSDHYFRLNGKMLTILSGSIHYFRVVPEYWLDRLTKMKAAGINTVTTYVPWNMHEEVHGQVRFDGILDIVKFLQLAQSVGLLAVVRPGPYICSEWDLGGLPHWLLRDPNMKLRTTYQPYMDEVRRYFSVLLPKLAELQFTKGGPIIAFQVENEYESYAADSDYIPQVTQMMKDLGITELLFTSDSDNTDQISIGSAPGVLRTVNGQNALVRKINNLKQIQPGQAVLVAEFWSGWFDQWGYDEPHYLKNLDAYYDLMGDVLRTEASINLYMFHGGTNFAFWNGAVGYSEYPFMKPIITSYDYDAPLSESGDRTAKYWATQSVLKKFGNPGGARFKLPEAPADILKDYYGVVEVHHYLSLDRIKSLLKPERHPTTLAMELLDYNSGSGQGFGYILYVKEDVKPGRKLLFPGRVYDRAQVMVNGKLIDTFDHTIKDKELTVQADFGQNSLWVLVENLGRINYGRVFPDNFEFEKQRKGLLNGVQMEGELLADWEIYSLDFNTSFMKTLGRESWQNYEGAATSHGPALFKTNLKIMLEPKDTYINMKEWRKGCLFVNGFNLGRYWSTGPQLTMYVPAPVLKRGENEIIIFELEKAHGQVLFQDRPELGRTSNKEID